MRTTSFKILILQVRSTDFPTTERTSLDAFPPQGNWVLAAICSIILLWSEIGRNELHSSIVSMVILLWWLKFSVFPPSLVSVCKEIEKLSCILAERTQFLVPSRSLEVWIFRGGKLRIFTKYLFVKKVRCFYNLLIHFCLYFFQFSIYVNLLLRSSWFIRIMFLYVCIVHTHHKIVSLSFCFFLCGSYTVVTSEFPTLTEQVQFNFIFTPCLRP